MLVCVYETLVSFLFYTLRQVLLCLMRSLKIYCTVIVLGFIALDVKIHNYLESVNTICSRSTCEFHIFRHIISTLDTQKTIKLGGINQYIRQQLLDTL